MKQLLKLLFLPAEDRALLLGAMWWVGAVRFGLWLVPFGTLQRALERMARSSAKLPVADQDSINRVTWALKVASRIVPSATCLTQALAAQVMLGRRAQPIDLRIGVAKTAEGRLEAHAWVELEGRIVIGEQNDLTRYTLLSSPEERP